MISRVNSTVFIEVWLLVIHLCIGDPKFSNPAAQRDRLSAASCKTCDKSQRPGGREQAALARIHSIHGLTNVLGVRHRGFPVRIHPQSDRARPDMIRFTVDES